MNRYIVLNKTKYTSCDEANVNYKIIDNKEFVDKYKNNPDVTLDGVETDDTIVQAIYDSKRYMLLLSGFKFIAYPREIHRDYHLIMSNDSLEDLVSDFMLSDTIFSSALDARWDKMIESVIDNGICGISESLSQYNLDEVSILIIDTQFKDEEE